MPNIKSNLRSLKKDRERHRENLSFKNSIKNVFKKLRKDIDGGAVEESERRLSKLYKLCDRGADRGYIKDNKAGRIKSKARTLLNRDTSKNNKEKEDRTSDKK